MRVSAAALLLSVAAVGALGAQEPATLSLSEALDLAAEYNPAYRRALADLRSAGADVRASFGNFLPNLNASMRFSGNVSTTVTGTGDFGDPVDLPEPRTIESSSVSQSVSTSVTIFDGLQNLNNYRAAQRSEDARAHAAASELNRVRGEVARAFFDAVRTRRLIEVEQELLESARDRLDATERLFRVAGASQVDVLGARVEVARQELAVERARGDSRTSLLVLLQTVGVMDDLDVRVAGGFSEAFDPRTELDVDALLGRAMTGNPQIRQLEASESAARLRATAARGRRLPSLSGNLSFGRSASLPDQDAFFELNPRNRGWNFGLEISLPIFSRFTTSQAITQADATRQSAAESLREGRLQLEQQVRAAYIDLVSAYDGLIIEQRALALSRRQLELAREEYRLGAIDFQRLQQVVDRASEAERQAVQAEFRFSTALANLEERVGGSVSQ